MVCCVVFCCYQYPICYYYTRRVRVRVCSVHVMYWCDMLYAHYSLIMVWSIYWATAFMQPICVRGISIRCRRNVNYVGERMQGIRACATVHWLVCYHAFFWETLFHNVIWPYDGKSECFDYKPTEADSFINFAGCVWQTASKSTADQKPHAKHRPLLSACCRFGSIFIVRWAIVVTWT